MANEVETISMLDLANDEVELLGFNPESDANLNLPPVPEGDYYVNLSFLSDDPDKRWKLGIWGKDEQKVFYTTIVAEVYNSPEGMYDGRKVRDNLVSTMVGKSTGTCSLQGVLQCVGGKSVVPPSCRTRGQLVVLANEVIGTGATGLVNLDWIAEEQLSEEELDALKKAGKKPFRKMGMKNFPPDPKNPGQYLPYYNHNGVDLPARNYIKRYYTADGTGVGTGMEEAPQATHIPQQAPTQAPTNNAPVARAPQAAQQAPKAPTAPVGQPPIPARAQALRAPQAPRR